jgi:hypothetical protein
LAPESNEVMVHSINFYNFKILLKADFKNLSISNLHLNTSKGCIIEKCIPDSWCHYCLKLAADFSLFANFSVSLFLLWATKVSNTSKLFEINGVKNCLNFCCRLWPLYFFSKKTNSAHLPIMQGHAVYCPWVNDTYFR